jgi:hypothetical protein
MYVFTILNVPETVSQADSVTSFVPQRFNPEASNAVKIPSSLPLCRLLAPAKASPDRNNGFSILAFEFLLGGTSVKKNYGSRKFRKTSINSINHKMPD